jgi:hypothetical protein
MAYRDDTRWDDLRVTPEQAEAANGNAPVWAKYKDNASTANGGMLDIGTAGYLTIPDDAAYQGNNERLFSFWYYPSLTTASAGEILIAQYEGWWELWQETDGRLTLVIPGIGEAISIGSVNAQTWNHILLSIYLNGSFRVARLYLDAVYQTRVRRNGANFPTPTGDLIFSANATGNHFAIDQIAIITDNIFSDAEAAVYYNNGNGTLHAGTDTDILGLWDLDESSGSTAADEDANGNDGTLTGTENTDYVWYDSSGHVGTSISLGVFLPYFSPDVEESLMYSVQLPHTYTIGSNIRPHVHWVGPSNGTAGQEVRWGLEYTWANAGAVIGDTTIIYGSTNHLAETIVADKSYITQLGTIVGAGKNISSQLICRLFRDSGHGDDDYPDFAALIEMDFHIEIDARGSRQEYVK